LFLLLLLLLLLLFATACAGSVVVAYSILFALENCSRTAHINSAVPFVLPVFARIGRAGAVPSCSVVSFFGRSPHEAKASFTQKAACFWEPIMPSTPACLINYPTSTFPAVAKPFFFLASAVSSLENRRGQSADPLPQIGLCRLGKTLPPPPLTVADLAATFAPASRWAPAPLAMIR
jgi:hypothetical protein